MRTLNLALVTLLIVLTASWLSIVFYPSAQDFMRANPFWNGLRDFSNRTGAEMATGPVQLKPRLESSVLIVIPYLPYQEKELQQMVDFVREGGTLLLLDDYGHGYQVVKALGLNMEFAGLPLLDPYLAYRNPWLPVVANLAPQLKEAGIQQLALNHATALKVTGPYEVLAYSSDTSFLDSNRNGSWDEGEPIGPLAVAARAAVGQGVVVAVADASILINSMVGRGDNGAFLKKLISQAGERPRVLIDTSHLTKAPLDRSRDTWKIARERMASPYPQALLVGALLALIFVPLWQKGIKVESKQ